MLINREKLNCIRKFLVDNIIQNYELMYSDEVRGNEEDENAIDLIEIIVDLYEYLHILICKEQYDYMWHWANKIGACVDTGVFDKLIEGYKKE